MGESWLFFGCRHEARDYLCRAELEAHVQDGSLGRLCTAFSRDDPAAKRYVQDEMRQHGAEVVDLLHAKGGRLYICGNSDGVVSSVSDAVTQLLVQHAGLSEAQASETKIGWKETGQLKVEHYAG